jgi:hypothetical protein
MADTAKLSELTPEGRWAESCPLPFTHLFSVKCECGRRFYGWPKMGWLAPRVRRYKRHWITVHRAPLEPYS